MNESAGIDRQARALTTDWHHMSEFHRNLLRTGVWMGETASAAHKAARALGCCGATNPCCDNYAESVRWPGTGCDRCGHSRGCHR